MKTPKTPVEFDYDLWTTEDGRYMVRVKRTGEVTEVDHDVMKLLRAEEKKLRRSYSSANPDEGKASTKGLTSTTLSLDSLPEEDVKSSTWLADPSNNIEMALNEMCIEDFRKTLTSIQRDIFDKVMLGGISARAYSKQNGVNHKTVLEAVASMRKRFKKFF